MLEWKKKIIEIVEQAQKQWPVRWSTLIDTNIANNINNFNVLFINESDFNRNNYNIDTVRRCVDFIRGL